MNIQPYNAPPDQERSLKEVLTTVEGMLPGKRDAVLLSMAVSIAHLIDRKTPLWLFIVGVPSSAKTEVVRLLDKVGHCYFLDTLTENAFLSGALVNDKTQPKDLLPLLDGKCLIIKDMAGTLSLREESVRKILGDLTNIFDDTFSKHSPGRGTVRYSSFFSLVACVTPHAISRHQIYMNQIGPRFLYYRMPEATQEEREQGLERMWEEENEASKIAAARELVSSYVATLAEDLREKAVAVEVPKESQKVISQLAIFISGARGTVITQSASFENDIGKTVSYYEVLEVQVEEPYRATKQLRVLAKALSVVKGQATVGDMTLKLLHLVAFASMPPSRGSVLSIIAKEYKDWSVFEVAELGNVSHRTISRRLEELVALKVLAKQKAINGLAPTYRIVKDLVSVIYPGVETSTQTPHRDVRLKGDLVMEDIYEFFPPE